MLDNGGSAARAAPLGRPRPAIEDRSRSGLAPDLAEIQRLTDQRGGRHVLVVPAAAVAGDPGLRPYAGDLDIVTGDAGPGGLCCWSGRTATWRRGGGRAACPR